MAETPHSFKSLNAHFDVSFGESPETKLIETVTMMLEEIVKRTRNKSMKPPKSISMFIETENLSSMLWAELEYWDG